MTGNKLRTTIKNIVSRVFKEGTDYSTKGLYHSVKHEIDTGEKCSMVIVHEYDSSVDNEGWHTRGYTIPDSMITELGINKNSGVVDEEIISKLEEWDSQLENGGSEYTSTFYEVVEEMHMKELTEIFDKNTTSDKKGMLENTADILKKMK